MAVIQKVKLNNGVTAEYFKLINVTINVPKDLVTMHYAVYVDKETRDGDYMPAWNHYQTVKLGEIDQSVLAGFYSLSKVDEVLKGGSADTIVPDSQTYTVSPKSEDTDVVDTAAKDASMAAFKQARSVGAPPKAQPKVSAEAALPQVQNGTP